MQTIRTTIENEEISLQDPLTHLSAPFPALVVGDDGITTIIQVAAIWRDNKVLHAGEEFEKIGLRDFFGDAINERIN